LHSNIANLAGYGWAIIEKLSLVQSVQLFTPKSIGLGAGIPAAAEYAGFS
jgi:hypothetical protein